MTKSQENTRRRPVEAIRERTNTSAQCEVRVRKALSRLLKAGVPFTVQDVCTLAGVGRTFIYDKRRADLTRAVIEARDASLATTTAQVEVGLESQTASWRERALIAEALAKSLRERAKELEMRITDLTGQLYDPDGTHLVEHNAQLRALVTSLTHQANNSDAEVAKLRRSLDAARANVKRERERNVASMSIASSAGGLGALTRRAP